MEQNKTGKYLKYAIGEIVLVVIGILIALQINNWNQNRQNRQTACIYLSNLIIDLENQLLEIEKQFEFEKEVVQYGEELLNGYRSNKAFIVDDAFSRQLSILNNRLTFKIANSTFEELLASGNTNLFENESLKTSLLSYFKDIERDMQVITQNNLYVDNHFAPMALEISTHYMPNLQIAGFKEIIEQGHLEKGNDTPLIDKEKVYGIISSKLKSNEYELKLLNEITYRYRISAVHLAIVYELKLKTINLSKEIKSHLNRCSSDD